VNVGALHAQDAPHFSSKRDLWLTVVIWGACGMSVAAGLAVLAEGAPLMRLGFVLLVCVGSPAFMLWVLYRTGYTFEGEKLVIRSGPFVFRVPLAEVESVTPSRNPLSSPACSLDRLHVRYQSSRRGVLVSPADKPGFLHELVVRCPHLTLLGDRVERREAS
jgi:hypothetical protein